MSLQDLTRVGVACLAIGMFANTMSVAQEMPTKVTSIEGITEYRLENGAQVLLFPDASKPMVTVNMTVFVGSRHEGYGEAGMAHLLEHMLFKGTPLNPKIPDELKNRGADFNGTTWLDRTNYYETLPAHTPELAKENLSYAIRMEADRLVNSFVRGEDLASEMTVVRNEFERGENNPRRVLSQRVQAAAYEWHNYGRTTIGNQSDIERVPIDRLQAFYRKFYRPDNIMLVVAGRFDEEQALKLISEHFGSLQPPDVPLDRTYTTEPPQDGERTVVLRRVGSTQFVQTAYHIPSGTNREYAAVEMLAYIFGAEPSGRLYRNLVVPEIASATSSSTQALHDPGLASFSAQVALEKSIEEARLTLIETVENVAANPITEEELKRAKTTFFKERELRSADSKSLAIELSEWAAEGDWRLYFLFRDHVEEVTADECTLIASTYFTRNNRTVGLFIPSEKSERVAMPARPNLSELLAEYQGREGITEGENFDPDPRVVEERTVRGQLSTGVKTAWLPKKTRGNTVNIELNLRYGNERSLSPFVTAIEFLPELMMRGTKSMNYEQLQDKLDELRCQMQASGTNGLLSISVETKRESLPEVIALLGDILRNPSFDQAEFEILKRQAIAGTESRMTEPTVLAGLALRRSLAPLSTTDIRYVPTLEEKLEMYRNTNVQQVRDLHAEQLNGQVGEIAVVGDFEPAEVAAAFESILDGWTTKIPFSRIAMPAQVSVAGVVEQIITPDKANAVFYAGEHIAMRDDNADYPALIIGNYILGGGALSSRLGDRIRQKEGLSYSVGSGVTAHPIDERTTLTFMAITNPDARDRLVSAFREEIERLLDGGVTDAELVAAKQGFLQSEQLARTEDSNLAAVLAGTMFAQRDMAYYADLESKVENLTVEDVNAALRKYIDLKRLLIYTAGDFNRKP